MLKDVLHKKPFPSLSEIVYTIIIVFIICVGCLHTTGYIINSPTIKGIAFTTGASPLPLVFSSYNGIETFSTTFTINMKTINNNSIVIPMTSDTYSQIKGPYNRRNVIGVLFSHGPFFQSKELINLRQQILHYAFCQQKIRFKYYLEQSKSISIIVKSNTIGNSNLSWTVEVSC